MRLIRNWKFSVPVGIVGLVVVLWLTFGYFAIQTAFIDDRVDEARPVFDAPAPAVMVDEAPAAGDAEPAEQTAPTPADTEVAEPETNATQPAEATDAAPTDATESQPTEPAEPVADAPAEPQIVTEFAGQFSGSGRYDVSGDAIVLGNGTGQRFLRFENFSSNNGPDLNVYLINPDDPNDFIDLGDLKGNIGEQNYELSPDIDLDRYSQVSIWCVRFGVGFGSADLAPAA